MKSVDLLIKMIRFQVQRIIEQFVRTLEMLLMVRNAIVTIPLPSNSTMVYMMAEYYALSTSMREVLPLHNLITAVGTGFGLDHMVNTTFKCTAHEDNTGCEMLANLKPGHTTPRSRFYDVKLHWFHSMLSKTVTVIRCATVDQLADIYMKPLPREPFERIQKAFADGKFVSVCCCFKFQSHEFCLSQLATSGN